VSKSIASTAIVSIVRTLLLVVLPVADSVCTFLHTNKVAGTSLFTGTWSKQNRYSGGQNPESQAANSYGGWCL